MNTALIFQILNVIFFILFAFITFHFTLFVLSLLRKKASLPKHEPPISVIIPAYNEEKNIGVCLNALLSTKYSPMQIIVVDDGSTDGTECVVKNFSGSANQIMYMRANHLGKTKALNAGIAKAKHEIIVTLDADTIVDHDFFIEIVRPFSNPKVGATSGSARVHNNTNALTVFQTVEYHYNNLIRHYFSDLFDQGIWFFGCVAAYRKSVLAKIDYFSTDTVAEDMDIALAIKSQGYLVVNVPFATATTVVPDTLVGLYNQRRRWWIGALQSLGKHRKLLGTWSVPTVFLYVNQYWWTFFAFVSLPILAFQIAFWWPDTLTSQIFYIIRWFSIAGPVYYLYKLPEWGITWSSFFGVCSGILSTVLIGASLKVYKASFKPSNLLAIIFYYPYTIILNVCIVIGIITAPFDRKKTFIK
ncbi:MAG TPA: glycosyltransferase [Acidobacteriota bacterium]|nr:glycosyltransferase [Acidobacteriota bacterium]